MVLSAINGAIFTAGFTAFVNPMAAAFGWSFAQISIGSSLRMVETGAFNPVMGWAVDRWPPTRLAIIGVTTMALGLLMLSQASNLAMFYASFAVGGIGSSLAISMVPRTLLARWFEKDLGKASGLLSVGVGLGGVFIPLLVKMIDTYSYQTVLIWVGFGVLIIGIPMSFLFRNPMPKPYILPPDNVVDNKKKTMISSVDNYGFTIKEATKTRAFWFMGAAFFLQLAAVNSVTVHIIPYLTGMNMSRAFAAQVTMTASLSSIAGRVGSGTLTDYFRPKFVAASFIALTSLGMFLLWNVGSSLGPAPVFLFAVVHGIGQGGMGAPRLPLLREYFGIKHFGKILGIVGLFTMLGQMLGAPLTGLVYDTIGNYRPQWLILGGVALLGAVMMISVPDTININRLTTNISHMRR